MSQLTEIAPSFAIVLIKGCNGTKEFERFVVSLAPLEQHSDRIHGSRGVRVSLQGAFVGVHRLVRHAEQLREAS